MTFADAGTSYVLILLVLYVLPTIIAFARHTPNRWSVWVINVFLGWTLVFWVIALAMAAANAPTKAQR